MCFFHLMIHTLMAIELPLHTQMLLSSILGVEAVPFAFVCTN